MLSREWNLRIVGGVVGLIGPILALWLYHIFNNVNMTFGEFINRLLYTKLFAPFLSLGLLINLFFFFAFIWLNRDEGSRGVLFATFLYALVVFYLKIFGS